MITIISGMQTGADTGSLEAARDCAFPTGGYVPKGFLTLDGPKPELAQLYHLVEYGEGYKPRTWKNVETANLTLRFYTNKDSAGEKCTMNAIKHFRKPFYDIDLNKYLGYNKYQRSAVIFAITSRISWYCGEDGIVNVAGNSEKTSPGIQNEVRQIMNEVLRAYANQVY
jgi:hypothetical protein